MVLGPAEGGVEGLEARRERIDEGDVVAPRWGDEGQGHADAGARLDVPGAVLVSSHVVGIVDGLVAARDREAVLHGGGAEVGWGVAHAEAIVEPPGAVLGHDEVTRPELRDEGHGDMDLVARCAAAAEGVLPGKLLAEPDAGDEGGGDLLIAVEVAVEG